MQIEGCKALYQCILAFDGKAIIPPNDGAGFDKSLILYWATAVLRLRILLGSRNRLKENPWLIPEGSAQAA